MLIVCEGYQAYLGLIKLALRWILKVCTQPPKKTIKYGAGASVDKIWSKDRCGGMSYVVKKVVVKYCADVARVWS